LNEPQFERQENQITAEELFQNRKITDMLTDAQMKQKDYTSKARNVFFAPEKTYFGVTVSVFVFNSLVINAFTGFFLVLLLGRLHRQLRTI
jgi:hypothetical protein